MNSLKHAPVNEIEVERYELFDGPAYEFLFDRRDFITGVSAGIILIVPLARLLAQEGQGESGRGFNERVPKEIGAWIHIDESGGISAYTGKVEMGQNIRTSLTQAVAEELHVPVSMVTLVMGDTDVTPFDMGTFGSRTTPTMAPQLRKAAAATRELLLDLAAQQLQVARDAVRIENARFVNHDATKSLTFSDLAKGLKLVKVIPEDIKTTATKDWTIAGSAVPKIDGKDFVTGKH